LSFIVGPVPDARPLRQRLSPPVLLAGGLLLASLALHVRDPHRSGAYGYCPWLLLTGTYCPGCGGLRAVNDLTHGNVGAAASSNLLFVALLPLLAVFWLRWVHDAITGVRRTVHPRRALWYAGGVLALAVAFAVVRNLPVGAWLAP
jgi:hypothetical protein